MSDKAGKPFKYVLTCGSFRNLNEIADYVGVSVTTLRDARDVCGSLEDAVVELTRGKKKGHLVNGTYYTSIKKIEEEFGIPHQRLSRVYLTFESVQKAFDYVMEHDYDVNAKEARDRFNRESEYHFGGHAMPYDFRNYNK